MFLEDIGTNELTKSKYDQHIRRFYNWSNAWGENIRHIKPADMFRYREYLISKKISGNSVYNYLQPIRRFYAWMKEMGHSDDPTTKLIIPQRLSIHTRGHLTVDQARQLINAMPQETIIDIRNFTIVSLMLQSGMRCVEISRLRIADFKHEGGVYFIEITRKGHRTAEQLGINQIIYDQFARYLESRTDDYENNSPAFVTQQRKRNAALSPMRVSRLVNQVLRDTEMKSNTITAHSLRHTAANLLLDQGTNLYDIKILMGHKSIQTTEIYLRSRDAQRLLENPCSNILSSLLLNPSKTTKNQ